MRNFSTANESDMFDGRVASQMVGNVRKAYDGLDEVWVVPACFQSATDDVCEVQTTPAYLLVGFDNDSIAREEGTNDRRHEHMEWIVPADACSDDSQGFAVDYVVLVAHQKVCRSP